MARDQIKFDFKKSNAYVESIHIQGIERTREDYIRAHIDSAIFNSTNFEQVLSHCDNIRKALNKLGCFSQVEVLIDHDENSPKNAYQVHINLDEMNNIGGGIHTSIGNNEGSLSTSVYLPNVFGKGERLSAEYSRGTRNHIDYRLSFSSPIGFTPERQLSGSVFRSTNDFPWSKYSESSTGVSFDFLRPFKFELGENYLVSGTHIFSYEGAWRQIVSNLDATFDVREQSGHSLKSSLKYTNEIDRRNHNSLPTQGGFLKSTIELAGLGGDVDFLRCHSDYQYTKTFFEHITTQFTWSKGFITPLRKNSTIAINDRFFLGGPLNLRGFTHRGIGPNKEDCSLGSDAYWLAGLHIYTPLPFLHNQKGLSSWLKTHSFLNVGNILSLSQLDLKSRKLANDLISGARISVGTGIVIAFGNIARLELNYAWPLRKFSNDKAVNGLQFGIGVNFN